MVYGIWATYLVLQTIHLSMDERQKDSTNTHLYRTVNLDVCQISCAINSITVEMQRFSTQSPIHPPPPFSFYLSSNALSRIFLIRYGLDETNIQAISTYKVKRREKSALKKRKQQQQRK